MTPSSVSSKPVDDSNQGSPLSGKKQTSLVFHGDRWMPTVGRGIDRRLAKRRSAIIRLLNIDPEIVEARRSSDPSKPADFVTLVDLALEEVSGELRRCWALLRDVNRAASQAKVCGILKELEDDPEKAIEIFHLVDPRVRHLIEDAYPGGWMALEADGPDQQTPSQTIRRVRDSLPKPKRGRPAGTEDVASDELALALAIIYERYSGRPPTRRLRVNEGKESKTRVEHGPYKEFIDEILAIVPPKLRRTRKGGLRGTDHFIRRGIQRLRKKAKKS